MSSKSDPPKLDAGLVKELAAYGLGAFDDPEEITSTTATAIQAISSDQRTNRDNSAKSLYALLAVLIKMRKEQRLAAARVRQVIYTVLVIGLALFALDKMGVIKIVLH